MRILSIDAATRTGWAFGMDGHVLGFGHINLAAGMGKKPSHGSIFASARTSYGALMRELDPDTVLLECPFSRGTATTRLLYGLAAIAEGLAHEHGAAFLDLEPSAVRRRLLGSGSAGKPEVLVWARGQGHAIEDTQTDEADALALLEVGFRDVRRQASAQARRKEAV